MTPSDLSHRRIQEVQRAMPGYTLQNPDSDRRVLAGLCRAVLSSIDVRDLKGIEAAAFIAQAEQMLAVASARKNQDIAVEVFAGEPNHQVVVACLKDQPFLVSSMRALFGSEGIEIRTALNSIVPCRRGADGKLIGFDGDHKESLMRFCVRTGTQVSSQELARKVTARLEMTRAMVRDFPAMCEHLTACAAQVADAASQASGEKALELTEIEGLLRWVSEENFVLFSVESYSGAGELQKALGIGAAMGQKREVKELIARLRSDDGAVLYTRSPDESPVHRAGKPGQFVFPIASPNGSVEQYCVVEGLFTYKALHTPPETIPVLRAVLTDLMRTRDVAPESHRGKSITNAYNSLPLEFLVSQSREQIWELTDRVLRAEAEGGSDVHIRVSKDRRFAFVFVTLSRWQFSEDLRLEVQELLQERFSASYSDYGVYMDRDDNAILHFYISGVRPLPEVDVDSLRDEILSHAKGWNERLRDALAEVGEQGAGETLFDDYQGAFSEEHMRRAGCERLARDIICLERIRAGESVDCELFVSRTSDHPGSLNLRLFTREALSLSTQLPVLAGFGFEVIDEYTREVRLPHMAPVGMHTFRLNLRTSEHGPLLGRSQALRDAIVQVFSGHLGDDRLNQLVISAELKAQEVQTLRAYLAYMHQLRAPVSREVLADVLTSYPAVAQSMMQWLRARFGPEASPEFAQRVDASLDSQLARVSDFTADRALRALAGVIRCTVRTNAWTADRLADEALAFKFDGHALPFGPAPRPFREIWVYHPEFEGVHLRGGKVARGGLRFSDRPDDFRTEIHDLVATQMVKNVLIVPMGAKGGFALRSAPSDRAQLRKAGDETYPKFISALLSITDNVVDGEVKTPEGIKHAEDPDPYLVVAADKGTAHLSDVANAQSQARGFWLDDAFASGGSNGYDHKATGITARGAWEANKRIFREIGIDPEADEITAIGVGDMSGDVFGNGLLRSQTIKLKAAFNHMHVFIDPDPDCAASYKERLRLFELPRSQWSDYSTEVLSKGGGVYSRQAKNVELSDEAKKMLGLPEDAQLSGEELIRKVMQMRVDLFWMGGIGTYVKASDESDADVGDKGNDSVRINASQLNCRVFAEGANLSITERGRVEFAKHGGLNYTASLDNSGGVDTSDHEVNLKILYAPLLASGKFAREDRNEALKEVEEEVCEMVLSNNRSQSRMASFDAIRSCQDAWRYHRAQERFVKELDFDPRAFAMPSGDEFARRSSDARGLFRCETTVLGLHAKMFAYTELLEDEPLPKAILTELARDYFPGRIRKRVGDEAIDEHLLRREIATTMVVNQLVDNMGGTFLTELTATGAKVREVVCAYDVLRRSVGLPELFEELFALEDKHRQNGIYEAMRVIADSVEEAVFFLLGPTGKTLSAECILASGRGLLDSIEDRLSAGLRERFDAAVQALVDCAIPQALAQRICRLDYLTVVLDTLILHADKGGKPEDILGLRLRVADSMHLTRLIAKSTSQSYTSPWDGPAAQVLCRQLEEHIHQMTLLVEQGDVDAMMQRCQLEGIREQIDRLLLGEVSVAGLVMVELQLRRGVPAKA